MVTCCFSPSSLAEQVVLPIPAIPVLLAVGALVRAGRMSLAPAIVVALFASLAADIIWYELGRRRGGRVLGLLCRISLEPDSCVRRTEGLFMKHGRFALLIAKFFPGLSTVARPWPGSRASADGSSSCSTAARHCYGPPAGRAWGTFSATPLSWSLGRPRI